MSLNDKTRRDFIKLLGLGSSAPLLQSPLMTLLGSILNSGTLAAADTSRPTGLYLQLWFQGGPFRYDSDMLMTPYDSDLDVFDRPAAFGTTFRDENGEYVGVDWKTIKMFGLNVPPIWNEMCPKADGGTRPMKELLQHLFNMRGIYVSAANNHDTCCEVMRAGEGPTAPGALAMEYATGTFPGLSIGANQTGSAYRNQKSLSLNTAFPNRSYNFGIDAGMNCITEILRPFLGTSSASYLASRVKLEMQLRNAYAAGAKNDESRYANARLSNVSLDTARELFNSSLGELGSAWAPLYDKYDSLMRRGMDINDPVPGFSDKPVRIKAGNYNAYLGGLPAVYKDYPEDLRTMIGPNTRFINLAAICATAEYFFTRGLTNTVFGDIGGWYISGVNKRSTYSENVIACDEHLNGRMTYGLMHAHSNRAMFACFLELKDRLKEKGLWERTVIDVHGEMYRAPNKSDENFEHGHSGNGVALYSGLLNEPMVLGNILRNIGNTPGHGNLGYDTYKGTWGAAGRCETLNVNRLDVGHYTSALASLLNVPVNLPQKPPIIIVRDGRVVAAIEKAKIIT